MSPHLSSESLRPRLLSKFNVSPDNGDDGYADDDNFEDDNSVEKFRPSITQQRSVKNITAVGRKIYKNILDIFKGMWRGS